MTEQEKQQKEEAKGATTALGTVLRMEHKKGFLWRTDGSVGVC